MRIEDISGKDLMVERLHSTSVEEAFGELLQTIGSQRNLDVSLISDCLTAVMDRHRKVPCGLARGLAFPNARLREISRPFLAVGMSDRGIELGGRDGSLSQILLLYLGRAPIRADERELLGRLSLALTDPAFAARLRSSEHAEDLWEQLRSIDREVATAVRGGGT